MQKCHWFSLDNTKNEWLERRGEGCVGFLHLDILNECLQFLRSDAAMIFWLDFAIEF